ncbi:MAG TPA: hypothetical protein VEY07_05645 [Thermoplasmata archaeon]|nr:hypothetical protein [Thermoplasmata archaeon]
MGIPGRRVCRSSAEPNGRVRSLTISTALVVIAILAVPGFASLRPAPGLTAPGLATPTHTLATSAFLAWGPPALNYRSPALSASPSSGHVAASGAPGGATGSGTTATPPPYQASGAMGWNAMMHCSKMPRIMGMQNKG